MSNRLVTTADDYGDICFFTSTATALIVDVNATADTTTIVTILQPPTDPCDPPARPIGGLCGRAAIAGGLLLVISGLFPWFVAGAIATEVLRGRALVATVVGVLVLAAVAVSVRSPLAWRVTTCGAGIVGLLMVTSALVVPPNELTASLGTGLCAVGSILCLLAWFADRWRRDWTPPSDDSDVVAPPRSTRRRVATAIGAVVAVAVGFLFVWPAPTPSLEADPDPSPTFEQSLERFEAISAAEPDLNVFEPCSSRLLSHGEPTDVVVVLFHGLTNCPEQYDEFGRQLFERGANVLILRAPHHGIANDDGTAIGGVDNVAALTPEGLRDYADESVDIATGLGDEVRVLGLSMGGVVASWVAQERADVDRVVAIAPALTIPGVPASLTRVFRNVFDKLPNIRFPGASKLDHAYSGETSQGLNATFAMAASVAKDAYSSIVAAGDVIVVLNPDDNQVDPDHLSAFTSAWAAGGGPVRLYRLPAVGLPHDVIDPGQPGADTDVVYPILFDLLDGST